MRPFHPFPAQGHTTDTAHLIVAGTPTREGTYVAVTRARGETHIYSADTPDRSADFDRLQALADRISRTEPELQSIQTLLAHEDAIRATLETTKPGRGHGRAPTGARADVGGRDATGAARAGASH